MAYICIYTSPSTQLHFSIHTVPLGHKEYVTSPQNLNSKLLLLLLLLLLFLNAKPEHTDALVLAWNE